MPSSHHDYWELVIIRHDLTALFMRVLYIVTSANGAKEGANVITECVCVSVCLSTTLVKMLRTDCDDF